MKSGKKKPSWHKKITALGVPLHIYNMPQANSVACGILVNAGTRDERNSEEAGLAHAFEHMSFQGTAELKDSKAISSLIEDTGGLINASTGKENTFFFSQVPAGDIEKSIYVLSQQLLHPTLPEEKIPIEMGNVVEEIKRKYDDHSDYLIHTAISRMYGEHPLGRDILGTEESVKKFGRNDFLKWLSHYYHANNFDFIVAGKLPDDSERKTENLFVKYFKHIRQNVPNQREVISQATGSKFYFENRQITQLHAVLISPTCAGTSRNADVLTVFKTMVSGGMSFPLFVEVREKLGLCYEIWAETIRFGDLGLFIVYIGTNTERYEKAIEEICKVINKSRNDAELLERAKKMLCGKIALGFENPLSVLENSRGSIALFGRARNKDEIIKTIESINIFEIFNAVSEHLNTDCLSRIFLVPLGFKIPQPKPKGDYSAVC